jgi:hypothetical protein
VEALVRGMIYSILQEVTAAGAQSTTSSWWSAVLGGGVAGAVASLFGHLLTWRNTEKTLKENRRLEGDRAKRARELEEEKAQEAALQKYFEQIGKLLVEQPLRRATPGDNLSTVARAQTLAMLLEGSIQPASEH